MGRHKEVTRPSIDDLLDALDYDPSTGTLTWAVRFSTFKPGDPVQVDPHGMCAVLGWKWQAGALVWRLCHEEEPGRIIPRDGDKGNLKIDNWEHVGPKPRTTVKRVDGGWAAFDSRNGVLWKSRAYPTIKEAMAAREGYLAAAG